MSVYGNIYFIKLLYNAALSFLFSLSIQCFGLPPIRREGSFVLLSY